MIGDTRARVLSIEALVVLDGVKAPKDLADALDAFRAIRPPADLDPTEGARVSAVDVPALLEKMATHSAIGTAHGQARGQLEDEIGRRVIAASGPVVDAAAELLRAEFDAVAPEFVQLLSTLPDTYILGDASHIAQRGTDTLTRWGQARDHALALDRISHLRAGLSDLGYRALIPGVLGTRTEFAHAADLDALDALKLNIENVTGFGQWPRLARIPGITLRWVTPREQTEMVRTLEATRPAKGTPRQPQRRTIVV